MITFARWAARSSTVAGVAGMAANVLLVAFSVAPLVRPGPTRLPVGLLSDLLGAVGATFMIPVALVLGGTATATLGVAGMAVFATVGFLLVGGALTPEVGTPSALGAVLVLAGWLLLVARQDTVPPRAARFGRRCGASVFAGAVIVAVGLALPRTSWPHLVVLGVGGLVGVVGWLAIPAWFLRMGRVLTIVYLPSRSSP